MTLKDLRIGESAKITAVGGEGAGLRAGGEAPRPAAGAQGGKAPGGADSKEAEKDTRKHQTPLSLEA